MGRVNGHLMMVVGLLLLLSLLEGGSSSYRVMVACAVVRMVDALALELAAAERYGAPFVVCGPFRLVTVVLKPGCSEIETTVLARAFHVPISWRSLDRCRCSGHTGSGRSPFTVCANRKCKVMINHHISVPHNQSRHSKRQ